jgi:hypothetical protein
VAILWLTSCSNPKEYTVLPNGDRWKLLAFDEQTQRLDSAGAVTMHITMFSHPDGDTLYHYVNTPFTVFDGPMWQFLKSRYVSDSLTYICGAQSALGGINGADSLRYHIRLLRMRSRASLRDARTLELLSLDSLMKHDTIAGRYTEYAGIWMRTLVSGDTSLVREGREVAIHYQGRTLDGKIVDDSRRSGGLLRFVKGNEHQVLEGIDLALDRMHRGETAEVIIPSWLAFGSGGSGGGIVAPYSTLVYVVEVKELAKN